MITEEIYKELIPFRDGPVCRKDGPTTMIKCLTDQHFIRVTENDVLPGLTIRPIRWEITIEGRVALSEFEQRANEKAERKSQQRFENQISVLHVLVTLVIFILGLVIEHYAGLISLLSQLFR